MFAPAWRTLAAPSVPPRPTYLDLRQRLREAAQNPDPRSRQDLLDYMSRDIAPALPTEEAALQLLAMNVVYLYLQPQARLGLCIRRNLLGNAACDYARHYRIADVLVDKTHGCVAYLLRPQSWLLRRAVVVFRGTALSRAGDVMAVTHPSGLRADIDPNGIGYQAFAHNAARLRGWVTQVQGPLTLTGHSLGGALATRLMAALPPQEQARCRLITFNAPGVDRATASAVAPGPHVVRVCNRLDPVTRAGAKHPQAAIYSYAEHDRFHVQPHLVARQLDGDPLHIAARAPRWTDDWQFLEWPRCALARLAYESVDV